MKNKIFLGLYEVCGQYSGLEDDLNDLGWPTIRVDLTDNQFEYKKTDNLSKSFFLWQTIWKLKSKERNISLKKVFYKLICESLALICVLQICFTCKAAVFGYGDKFFKGSWEFFLYKIFNVKTIFLFHGSDSRPPYLSAKFDGVSDRELNDMTAKLVNKIQKIERFSNYIICAPTISQFLSKPYLHSYAVGTHFDVSEIDVSESSHLKQFVDRKTVRVVHCPSNPEIKKTAEIREVISSLKNEGLDFEYIEINNASHKKILDTLKDADLLIDCFNSDSPIGVVGLEAGVFGVPSIVSGNADDIFSNFAVKKHLPPSIYVEPAIFKEELRKLITNQAYRQSEGKKIYNYLHDYILKGHVAKRYEQLFLDDANPEWFLDPKLFSYCHGSLPLGVGLENMQRLSDKYSFEALGLDNRFQKYLN